MKNKNKQPKIQIQFPNLLLIPVISFIGSTLKIFGFTQYDWFTVLITAPIAIYFMWCIGYCLLAMFAIWIYNIFKGN